MFVRPLGIAGTALIGIAATAAAQGTDSTHGHAGMSGMQMDHRGLMAMLAAPSGARSPAGMAMVNGTSVQLALTGDQAGATRRWHVHKGSCADDHGVAGEAGKFPPVSVGATGKGTAKATLGTPLADVGSYFVAVHASASDMKTIVACGPLSEGKM